MKKIGLIAGKGNLPLIAAKNIKNQENQVYSVLLENLADQKVSNYSEKYEIINVTSLQKVIDFFKDNGISEILFLGKIEKKDVIFDIDKFDDRLKKMMFTLASQKDNDILLAFANEFINEGITILDSTMYLKDSLLTKGILTNNSLTENEKATLDFGYKIAREVANLDIGQTIVAKDMMIVAVEALEGTDKTIQRAHSLSPKGNIVIKVARPKQDFRFDVPTIGLDTVNMAKVSGVSVIGFESERTIVIDLEEIIKVANESNIKFVAI